MAVSESAVRSGDLTEPGGDSQPQRKALLQKKDGRAPLCRRVFGFWEGEGSHSHPITHRRGVALGVAWGVEAGRERRGAGTAGSGHHAPGKTPPAPPKAIPACQPPHSCRRGGAVTPAHTGADGPTIKLHGRWARGSDCFLRYLGLTEPMVKTAARRMARVGPLSAETRASTWQRLEAWQHAKD